jgi:hypothetical protein
MFLPGDSPIQSVVNMTFYLKKNKLRILLVSCAFVCISFSQHLNGFLVIWQVYYTKIAVGCVS